MQSVGLNKLKLMQMVRAADPDQMLRLDMQMCFPLYAASRLVTQSYAPLLGAYDLTYPGYLVLMVLWERDGQSVSEIGERLYLDSGTLTPLLKKLEAKKLVSRSRDELDERTVRSYLTEESRNLKSKIVSVPIELFCRSGMLPEDVEFFRTALNSLINMSISDNPQEKNNVRSKLATEARRYADSFTNASDL